MKKFEQEIKNQLTTPQMPPLDAWENIQKKLDEKEKKKRIIPLFYWIGSSAACFIFGVGVVYLNQSNSENVVKNSEKIVVIKSSTKKNQNNVEHNPSEQFNSTKHSTNSVSNHSSTELTKVKSIKNKWFIELFESSKNEEIFFNETNSAKPFSTESIIQNTDEIRKESNYNTEKKLVQKPNLIEDSTKNEIELAIEEQKELKKNNIKPIKSATKFAVSSYVSPAILLDSKSILSDEFNENNIKNAVTVAYGAKFSVKVNERLNVRAGISKIDLEQQTNQVNIGISSSVVGLSEMSAPLANAENIRYNSNMFVYNSNPAVSQNIPITMGKKNNRIQQKIQYVEIPLEIEYKLFSLDKFNLFASAGGSYYSLTKNTLEVMDLQSNINYDIGKATNLNNNSFSANAGLKFEYLLSNKTSLNLEPHYRYMMNSIQNTSLGNPSILGINLGFSFQF